jgi:hypothetical protein
MVKHSKIFFFLFLCFSFCVSAQQKDFYYKGLVKTTGTIAPGFRVSDGELTMSLHGYLEYFMEEHVSWRGDGFYYMGEQEKPISIYKNSTLKWGAFYHFHKPKRRLDLYVGLQPGLNFVQPVVQDADDRDYYYKLQVVPVASGVAGLNFHFGDFFNMFIEGTYIGARYMGNGLTKVNASEFRISGGLGFHILNKKYCNCNQ